MKNKTKIFMMLISFMFLFLLVFQLINTYKSGDTKHAKIVINSSNFFTEDEIKSAINENLVVFKKEKKGAELIELEYNDQLYVKELLSDSSDDSNVAKNYIVLKTKFKTGSTKSINLPPNTKIDNWLYIFQRKDKSSPWTLRTQGV